MFDWLRKGLRIFWEWFQIQIGRIEPPLEQWKFYYWNLNEIFFLAFASSVEHARIKLIHYIEECDYEFAEALYQQLKKKKEHDRVKQNSSLVVKHDPIVYKLKDFTTKIVEPKGIVLSTKETKKVETNFKKVQQQVDKASQIRSKG